MRVLSVGCPVLEGQVLFAGAQSHHFVPLALQLSLQLTFLLSWLLCACVSPSPRSFRSPCPSHLIAPFKKKTSPGYSLGAVYVCSFVCSLSRYTPTVYQALFWVRACIHAQNRQKSLLSPRKCMLHTMNKLDRRLDGKMLRGKQGSDKGAPLFFPSVSPNPPFSSMYFYSLFQASPIFLLLFCPLSPSFIPPSCSFNPSLTPPGSLSAHRL